MLVATSTRRLPTSSCSTILPNRIHDTGHPLGRHHRLQRSSSLWLHCPLHPLAAASLRVCAAILHLTCVMHLTCVCAAIMHLSCLIAVAVLCASISGTRDPTTKAAEPISRQGHSGPDACTGQEEVCAVGCRLERLAAGRRATGPGAGEASQWVCGTVADCAGVWYSGCGRASIQAVYH